VIGEERRHKGKGCMKEMVAREERWHRKNSDMRDCDISLSLILALFWARIAQ
jgi:hypothetical protein